MSKNFSADTRELKHLLSSIRNKERALPDFQRDFVWDASAIQELLHSVLKNFPAGSLLEIQQTENVFRPRAFAGAPEIPANYVPAYLILDGQQRLTSLYQALYGTGRYRFYLNLQRLMRSVSEVDPDQSLHEVLEIEEAMFHETLRLYKGEVVRKENWPLDRQAKELVFPISTVLGETGGYEAWRDSVVDIRKEAGIYKDGDKETLRRLGKELIENLSNYHFPLVTLQSNTPTEAVCTIFETLNRTGIKLSVFDLLVARMYADDIRMRDSWEDAKSDYPILKEFWIDPYYVLQTMALRSDTKGMGECKRSTVLKLSPEDYRRYWPSSVAGMAEGLRILREECGVMTGNWLPYYTFLIPFAAVIAETRDKFRGPSTASWKDKLQRWFWSSTLAQSFENAPNSAAKTHFADLLNWINMDIEPPFVAEALSALENVDLLSITPRQRARYRGFMCAILHRGVRDFYKAEPISADKLFKGEVNDHHIFPKAEFGVGEWTEAVDSIPNRTLIDEKSNKIIRDKRPSVYIPQLRGACRAQFLDDIFADHMIPIQNGSSILNDDLSGFMQARSDQLKREMRGLIGANLSS